MHRLIRGLAHLPVGAKLWLAEYLRSGRRHANL